MTNGFLNWSNYLKEKIDTLSNEIDILRQFDKRAIVLTVQIKKTRLRYSPFYNLKEKEIELNSDFSYEALIKLYDEELERLIMIYTEANENNYTMYDIGLKE